jgi:lysophospholipase L1-like esterase
MLALATFGACVPHARPAARESHALPTQAPPPELVAPPAEPPPSGPPPSAALDPDDEHVPATDELAPLAVPTAIEDASGRALTAFHAALRRAQAGAGQARIAFYGASHVASDMYTGVIRARLQARFGDAGPGFVLPAKPWRWYVHGSVEFERGRGFKPRRVTSKDPRDDRYGYAGVALDADARRAAHAALRTRGAAAPLAPGDRVELAYLAQPRGGHIRIEVDGHARTLATDGAEPAPGFARVDVAAGPHRVNLRTEGNGPVRVFGVAIERDAPGVVLDTLGVPGARARDQLHWDEAVHRAHLAWRRPDLVVLAYGTNESGDDVPIALEEERVHAVIARVRAATPAASCLLVGPSDRPLKLPDGTYEPRPRTEEVIEMQRRLALAHGCGFFDVVKFMGGPMSMLRWSAAVPPLGGRDLVHFTRTGYERLGDVLHDALLDGYADASAPQPMAALVPESSRQPAPSFAPATTGSLSGSPSCGATRDPRPPCRTPRESAR